MPTRYVIFFLEIAVLLILYLAMGMHGMVPFSSEGLTFVCVLIFCLIGLCLLYLGRPSETV